MSELTDDQAEAPEPAPRPRRLGRRIAGVLILLVTGLLAYGWISREELADDLISSQLDKLGLEASYRVESIGPQRQVITDIVIGDPANPDLTIERAEISLVARFPLPGIGRLELTRPRLYGSFRDGKLSFGALDPLLFEQESTEPFALPDMELVLDDGRALIETDYGPVGAKAAGSGNLQGGFSGIVAATAPRLELDDCVGEGATLYGKVSIDAERPGFAGPLRLASLDCAARELSLRDLAMEFDARLDRGLDGIEGSAGLTAGATAYGDNLLRTLQGSTDFTWRENALTAQYELAFGGVRTPQLQLAGLAIDGSVRSREGIGRIELQADLEGSGIRPGPGLDAALADSAEAASGTLLGPMLAQIRTALAREGQGSTLAAGMTLRKTGEVYSLVMPQASLRGSSGATLLAVSRFQLASTGGAAPRFSGNFTTGGAGLPRITGRMEDRGASSDMLLRLRMAEYRVRDGSLELPELTVAQGADGRIGFAGSAIASGPVPGGSAEALVVPIRGNWSPSAGLIMWRQCAALEFRRLTLASLTLDRHRLQLCPPTGGAILRSDAAGTRIAAGAPSLELTGRLGETRAVLKTGAVGLAWPGSLTARDVDVALGPADSATRFRLSELDARIESDIGGSFAGADAKLFSVPLDVLDATGEWRYADGRLSLTKGAFRLEDRQSPDRFAPLVARDATLALEDNIITAHAELREPSSDREVVEAQIFHDLGDTAAGRETRGHADLLVRGLVFDERLQPDMLTGLALGVIANTYGTVTGEGRIEWDSQDVTSRGRFTTSDLDFAAAFGPVDGLSGTLEFTDLLNFVTAPNQRIRVQSFNPGVEVESGEMSLEIQPGYLLVIHGGRWPFLGGTLVLAPAETRLAESETRRYTLRLEGVDAAQFVERMDLANISASGHFDGTVPLVFDENGGRIEGGYLLSRPPGGNVAYIGRLTYEDMTPMANYAFDALKSLDYREMEITLDGSLTGEIVTRVRFDGIRQGSGTSQNIVTKQLAKLPIRFNVNIHAPFYRLIGSFKGMYDPTYVRDPREIPGLLDPQGTPGDGEAQPAMPATRPEDIPSDESAIQHAESE